MGPRRLDDHLSRQHHLLERPGADPLHRLRHRLLEPLRARARSRSAPPPVGWGSASGRRRLAQRRQPGAQPPRARGRVDTRPAQTRTASDGSDRRPGGAPAPASPAARGETRTTGAPRPPSGANANPPTQTGPAPAGRRSGSSAQTPAGRLRAGADQVAKALRAARDDLVSAAERGEREPVAIGLLPAEPAIAGEPRGEHGGARVRQLHRHRDADQPPLCAPPRRAAPPASRARPSPRSRPATGRDGSG